MRYPVVLYLWWSFREVGGVQVKSYEQGWDDCLDFVLAILGSAESITVAKDKVESLQVMVKAKKFEQIKSEFGVIGDLF